jgi:hypothetical protein
MEAQCASSSARCRGCPLRQSNFDSDSESRIVISCRRFLGVGCRRNDSGPPGVVAASISAAAACKRQSSATSFRAASGHHISPKNVRFRLLSNSKGAKCCSLGTNDIPHLAQVLLEVIAKYYIPRALPSSAAAVGVGAVRRLCVCALVCTWACVCVFARACGWSSDGLGMYDCEESPAARRVTCWLIPRAACPSGREPRLVLAER